MFAEHSGSKSVTHLDSAPNRIRDEIASRRITSTKQSKSRYGDDLLSRGTPHQTASNKQHLNNLGAQP
ncbi:hypothetical protein C5H14_04740 [Xylella fastidiosa]|nr:hypothetical protein C5H14_04740 [Xylella fastidiosa]